MIHEVMPVTALQLFSLLCGRIDQTQYRLLVRPNEELDIEGHDQHEPPVDADRIKGH